MFMAENNRLLRKGPCNGGLNWLTADFTWADPRMIFFTDSTDGRIVAFNIPIVDGLITFTTILTDGYSMFIHECSHLLLQDIMLLNQFIIEVL